MNNVGNRLIPAIPIQMPTSTQTPVSKLMREWIVNNNHATTDSSITVQQDSIQYIQAKEKEKEVKSKEIKVPLLRHGYLFKNDYIPSPDDAMLNTSSVLNEAGSSVSPIQAIINSNNSIQASRIASVNQFQRQASSNTPSLRNNLVSFDLDVPEAAFPNQRNTISPPGNESNIIHTLDLSQMTQDIA